MFDKKYLNGGSILKRLIVVIVENKFSTELSSVSLVKITKFKKCVAIFVTNLGRY